MKNILAENMRRFGTKNLNEQQLDLFKFNHDTEYYMDRPELFGRSEPDTNYETLKTDLKMAMKRKDGRKAIQVAEILLKYITVGVYEKLDAVKQDDKYGPSSERFVQSEIDKIQTVNQDVIKDAINILKVSPQNIGAMETIYDIINDLHSYVD